jgi:hypothetical protein
MLGVGVVDEGAVELADDRSGEAIDGGPILGHGSAELDDVTHGGHARRMRTVPNMLLRGG